MTQDLEAVQWINDIADRLSDAQYDRDAQMEILDEVEQTLKKFDRSQFNVVIYRLLGIITLGD